MKLHRALLDAILEAPDDDAPRLVYADWLEENGDPERAEFIRLQIFLPQLPPDAPVRAALTARERALLQEYGQRWAELLRGLDWGWRFVRGFIEAIQIPTFHSQTVPELERVAASTPIQVLSIYDFSPDGEALVAAAPSLARLRELRFEYVGFFRGDRLSDHMQLLLTSPQLAGLTKLYMVGGRNWGWLNKKALRAIITSPSLTGVSELTLVHDWHGLAGDLIQLLARSPRKANLEKLSLFCSQIAPHVMWELGSSHHLARLYELDFRHCQWERATWEALLEIPLSRQLKRLFLYNSQVVDPEGRYLSDVGMPCTGKDFWEPDLPLQQALLTRFGNSIVDFTTEEIEPVEWKSWDHWKDSQFYKESTD